MMKEQKNNVKSYCCPKCNSKNVTINESMEDREGKNPIFGWCILILGILLWLPSMTSFILNDFKPIGVWEWIRPWIAALLIFLGIKKVISAMPVKKHNRKHLICHDCGYQEVTTDEEISDADETETV